MKSLFLEYLPSIFQIKEEINFGNYVNIMALTPLACYQLDKLNIQYSIPEDYYYPELIDVKDFSEYNVFCLNELEKEETKQYWKRFLKEYKTIFNVKWIDYVGDQYKILKNLINKHNNEY